MTGTTVISMRPHPVQQITKEDLLTLAGFHDPSGEAVSFLLSRITTPDKTHREEAINVKNMIHNARVNA
jgi:hypothetical protein